jgi:hypothetical protein
MPRGIESLSRDAHPAPHRDRVSLWILAFGAAGGPVAWVLRLVVNYGLASHACFPGDALRTSPPGPDWLWPALIAVDIAALEISVAAGLVSYAIWQATRREFAGDVRDVIDIGEGRTRFLALWGMMTGIGFSAATLFDLVMLGVLRPCA